MDIREEDLGNGIHRIALAGRMDIDGVGRVETRLAGMTAAPRRGIVIDLAEVPFMASIGLRALLVNAKALRGRGGRMALLAPVDAVRGVLASAGVDQLIPVCDTLDDAIARVAG